ncbi:MAG: Asp-tRNA(Asn)/Glu-tRNA(Gln) amidotransferase subunit GatA [bacterium]|nr:Asp-tRNA(Asn)/Glu-tRNA(Gln) amidotransferase subunit GatA [bacterium]
MNLCTLSALELATRIQARELSSVEATQYFLSRIAETEQHIHAFTHLAEGALDRAEQIDSRLKSGEQLSPLAGVPIAIKDVLCTIGDRTTCGSRMLSEYRPPYMATAVQKLVDAGLVIVGKTNMDEFAMGGSTESSYLGPTRNPWDVQRTPGGSSGGAAASLAAGMCSLSIGSDTGGSVRQPAAFCGVCGLKPTYGRISRYGLVAFASSLDQVGPLAHHVQDLAACMAIMAGHDNRDSTSLAAEVPDYLAELGRPLKGLKVGIIREQVEHAALEAEVRDAVSHTQRMLEELGASILEIDFPHQEYAVPTYYLVAPCEASSNLSRYDGVHYGYRELGDASAESPLDAMISRSRSRGFGPEVKRRIMLGTFALSAGYYDAYYKKALQVRRLITQDYHRAFQDVDLLLGPVTPTPAYPLGEKLDDPVQMYLGDLFTVGANLAGLPAISVPAGFTSEGLPVAVQLQAPALEESRLLNAAFQLQQAGLFTPQVAEPPAT